jgi:hypothetical protein
MVKFIFAVGVEVNLGVEKSGAKVGPRPLNSTLPSPAQKRSRTEAEKFWDRPPPRYDGRLPEENGRTER